MRYKVGDYVQGFVSGMRAPMRGYVTELDAKSKMCHLAGDDGQQWLFDEQYLQPALPALTADAVNHPSHYTWGPVEVIEITERLGFCLGNVVKYVLRADHKGNPIEDLKKARWYLDREIQRREKGSA